MKFNQIILFIRSSVFSLVMMLSTFFYSFICLLSYPLPVKHRYAIVTLWTRFIIWNAKMICGIRYQVIGREHIPKTPVVILSKHQSAWETFFFPTLFQQPAIILKRELLWVPFFGWGLAAMSPIVINRKKQREALKIIFTKGKEYLQNGRSVLIFPEGTRMAPGSVGEYHAGGTGLARKANVPVLPVAHNAGTCWPKRGFIKYPGLITVVIGPTISPEGRSSTELTNEVKAWIETTINAI